MSGEEKRKLYEKELQETGEFLTARISGSGKVYVEGVGTIHVSGSGQVSQDEIRISGSGRLPGGLKVKSVHCSGSVTVQGDIEAEDLSFSGSASIDGNATAKRLTAAGSLSVYGEVKATLVETAGSCRFGKGVEAVDALRMAGSLRASGNVKAKNLVEFRGAFAVDGRIVTNRFEARLVRSDISESHVFGGIQAGSVNVRKRERDVMIFGLSILGRFFGEGRLRTTSIISDGKVYLENVDCDDVQGWDVTIGKGCTIRGKTSYSNTISVDPDAKLASAPQRLSVEK